LVALPYKQASKHSLSGEISSVEESFEFVVGKPPIPPFRKLSKIKEPVGFLKQLAKNLPVLCQFFEFF
jgi:hypothetical protein